MSKPQKFKAILTFFFPFKDSEFPDSAWVELSDDAMTESQTLLAAKPFNALTSADGAYATSRCIRISAKNDLKELGRFRAQVTKAAKAAYDIKKIEDNGK